MVEIIPAVLVKDEREFRQKVEALGEAVETIQLDAMDGKFVENVTWADPNRLAKMPLPMSFEVHLMVDDPLSTLEGWSRSGCIRAIIHAEAVDDAAEALRQIKAFGMEAGLTFNPETPIDDIEDAVEEADVVQVMGVAPGRMGQEFDRRALDKVRELRDRWPDLIISVDGGVSVGIARALAEAGADRLVAGSAVWKDGAPLKAIEALEKDVDLDA